MAAEVGFDDCEDVMGCAVEGSDVGAGVSVGGEVDWLVVLVGEGCVWMVGMRDDMGYHVVKGGEGLAEQDVNGGYLTKGAVGDLKEWFLCVSEDDCGNVVFVGVALIGGDFEGVSGEQGGHDFILSSGIDWVG